MGLDKAAPLKRSGATKETLAKEFSTPARPTAAALRRHRPFPADATPLRLDYGDR